MVLVDTSVLVLSSRRPGWIEQYVAPNEIAICPPVLQELLQGVKANEVKRLHAGWLRFVMVEDPVPLGAYEDAAEIYRVVRANAHTPRSSIDCLIAAIGIRNDVEVLHHDRDFDVISRFTKLRARNITP
jgi:predicted nucleic acid-binding protein